MKCATPALLALAISFPRAHAASPNAAAEFKKHVQPVLAEHCFDCHADGANKGGVAFDEGSLDATIAKTELWSKVLKNVRAGVMPPAKKARLTDAQLKTLEQWVKYGAFGLDPKDPDPGRVTLRRLNRIEYRNTIRDLMGVDYKVDDEFPPDDTGYGFDNIGDVLSVSPLLLEKYMQAAETIVANAVPLTARTMPERMIPGGQFRGLEESNGDRLSFYEEAALTNKTKVAVGGTYRFVLEVNVSGEFVFDPGRCSLTFFVDGNEALNKKFTWANHNLYRLEVEQKLEPGDHVLSFTVVPLTDAAKKINSLHLRVAAVRLLGPTDNQQQWTRTKNYERFFPKEEPPKAEAERREYARSILQDFAAKAFRRPVDSATVNRLAEIAEASYRLPGKSFEEGVTRAMVAVLSSPRFLFRVEESETPSVAGMSANVDQHALASRLSYFLWSTKPDEELLKLAASGKLRENLEPQVKRMLADRRSDALVENFTGQWLQARDIEGIDINSRAVLARDRGEERDAQFSRRRFQELANKSDLTPEEQQERQQLIEQRRRRFGNRPMIELDGQLRRAMKLETEMRFGYIAREDRSLLELINSDYTFLNERLAKHYGLTNLSVNGNEMRKVTLPEDSPRGGVLTDGSVLIVTSNPTRTSPVKRGLFVLDNILGTPPPPPPPDIPQLEESEKAFKDREPTLREVLAIHREQPLCSSCHNRMDPLGLALENFNALGMWREKERGQDIESAGKLITGEQFTNIRELKKVLATDRRGDFYRCITEKLLIYALGRGLEHYDVETVDRIVAQLEASNGRFSSLLMGVVNSAPFQKRRNISVTNTASAASEMQGPDKPKS